ncbi:MAG: histidine phosphatase family protein [Verrucomicrobia bacterium]|jgi:broad specificity phosphatase PhoE|nr:histidine phosphatase family protein [Verrucomicrobiota bacterium]
MPHTRLYLIRHAEVEPKYHRTFGGRIDMNLSDLGREQAQALARHLERHTFHAVYASPMKRVQQTLAPFARNGHPPAQLVDDLREVDFGDWTGLVWEQVQERFGVSPYEWLVELEHARMPNAETGAQLCARVAPVLKGIRTKHPGQTVAVFCHGGVIRAALSVLLELPLVKTAAFEVDYASVTQVKVGAKGAEIQLLNFTPWRHA